MNDQQEHGILTIARAISYAIVWVALAVAVFRIGVGALWGSGSDLGLVAAVALAAAAVFGLAWIGAWMLRDIDKRSSKDEDDGA